MTVSRSVSTEQGEAPSSLLADPCILPANPSQGKGFGPLGLGQANQAGTAQEVA